MERLSFRVLGPLWVGGATGEVLVPGSRRRTLLIRLLMSANEVVPAQRLVGDVWDGAPPAGAAATLQSHVSWLRRLLGPDRVEFRDGGYVANPKCTRRDWHDEQVTRRRRRSCWNKRFGAGAVTPMPTRRAWRG